jgi:hypothetical protein
VVSNFEHHEIAGFAVGHGTEPEKTVPRYQAFSAIDQSVRYLASAIKVRDRVFLATLIAVADACNVSGGGSSHQLKQVTITVRLPEVNGLGTFSQQTRIG